MKLRDKASAGFGAVMDYLAYVAAALIGFVWLTVVVMIVTRFFLNKSMAGGLEITEDALLYITFLGAPWLLKLDGHVRIDIVTNHLRPRVREWVNMTVSVLGAMSCLALTWYGARSALEHLQIGITHSDRVKASLSSATGSHTRGQFSHVNPVPPYGPRALGTPETVTR